MSGDDAFELLALDGFDWDESKAASNLAKHGIDFEDAVDVFYVPTLVRRSDRDGEQRWIAIGRLGSRLIAVVFTRRNNTLRIISARRARKNEERAYRNQEVGRPPQRKD